jgi:CHAT domain-containing protein
MFSRLELEVPQVTLIACDRVQQEVSPGDESMGLSVFPYVGATLVLGTLWSIWSLHGRLLLTYFIETSFHSPFTIQMRCQVLMVFLI